MRATFDRTKRNLEAFCAFAEAFAEGSEGGGADGDRCARHLGRNLGAWNRPLELPAPVVADTDADADFQRMSSGLDSSLHQLIPICAVKCSDDTYDALHRLSAAGFMCLTGADDPPYEAALRRLACHFDAVHKDKRKDKIKKKR